MYIVKNITLVLIFTILLSSCLPEIHDYTTTEKTDLPTRSKITLPAKSGIYKYKDWVYRLSILRPGKKSEQRNGSLFYKGQEIIGEFADTIRTPFAKMAMTHLHGWQYEHIRGVLLFSKDGNWLNEDIERRYTPEELLELSKWANGLPEVKWFTKEWLEESHENVKTEKFKSKTNLYLGPHEASNTYYLMPKTGLEKVTLVFSPYSDSVFISLYNTLCEKHGKKELRDDKHSKLKRKIEWKFEEQKSILLGRTKSSSIVEYYNGTKSTERATENMVKHNQNNFIHQKWNLYSKRYNTEIAADSLSVWVNKYIGRNKIDIKDNVTLKIFRTFNFPKTYKFKKYLNVETFNRLIEKEQNDT